MIVEGAPFREFAQLLKEFPITKGKNMSNTIRLDLAVELLKVVRDSPSMNDEELVETVRHWASKNNVKLQTSDK